MNDSCWVWSPFPLRDGAEANHPIDPRWIKELGPERIWWEGSSQPTRFYVPTDQEIAALHRIRSRLPGIVARHSGNPDWHEVKSALLKAGHLTVTSKFGTIPASTLVALLEAPPPSTARKHLSLTAAAKTVGRSKGWLSKLCNGNPDLIAEQEGDRVTRVWVDVLTEWSATTPPRQSDKKQARKMNKTAKAIEEQRNKRCAEPS